MLHPTPRAGVLLVTALLLAATLVPPTGVAGDDRDDTADPPPPQVAAVLAAPPEASAPPARDRDPVTVHRMAERPGYPAMVRLVEEMQERYATEADEGTLLARVPGTDEGRRYAHDFLLVLAQRRAELATSDGQSVDPAVLDARIQARTDDAIALERRFLAGEDLEVEIAVDGYRSDGRAPDMRVAERVVGAAEVRPDADGSYAGAASDLAAALGLTISYRFADVLERCTGDLHEHHDTLAAFCADDPTTVFVNAGHPAYPAYLHTEDFVETVRHELAHARIAQICGTSAPPVAGGLVEGVTSSYAVRYLGADAAGLTEGLAEEYQIGPETDRVARLVGDEGRCA